MMEMISYGYDQAILDNFPVPDVKEWEWEDLKIDASVSWILLDMSVTLENVVVVVETVKF